ncbi:MAG TPA: SAM-dependent chlorinase/fluorinase [Thermoanaerobaculia bacterium]|nr:SAM-dependent chlorinase/fluorinase [Thermoanaerobaculia bacterium]
MLLSLLTDFGTTDYYVAAVKGTILRLAPGTALVDISHEVPPGDIETGSFLLRAAVPSFPEGTVHLAVVDPGVGSRRRMLAVRSGSGLFVAPDNGLLDPFLDGAEVRSVERSELFLVSPGQTFHGRDRFAPIAAALLRGERLESLGPEIPDPVRWAATPPRREPGRISGRVIHVDRYGNLVTDVPAAWLPPGPCRARIGVGNSTSRRASHYAEIPPGEAAMIPGSLGTVELSLNGEDLARAWKIARGAAVGITWNES